MAAMETMMAAAAGITTFRFVKTAHHGSASCGAIVSGMNTNQIQRMNRVYFFNWH